MMVKILILIHNLIVLTTLNPKVIRFLWNECPVRIYLTGNKDKAVYWHKIDTGGPIRIDLGVFPNRKIRFTALLHEVGHYKDSMKLKHKFAKTNEKQLEKTAWKHAIEFSHKYGIEMNFLMALAWLRTYDTGYRCLENKVANKR